MNNNSAANRSIPLPVGKLYEVDGRRLLLHRSGVEGPSVVILPGAGFVGLDYWNIQQSLALHTTCVIYDRAGTGWSDSIKLPRSAAEVVDELMKLLQTAGIPSPYILIGHSLGGIYARRFAQRYPNETAGIVMLDPTHEGLKQAPKVQLRDLPRQLWNTLRAFLFYRRIYRPMFELALTDWPPPIREQLIEYHLRSQCITMQEGRNVSSELFQEIVRGGDMPDRPMIVLTAMDLDPAQAVIQTKSYLRLMNDFKNRLYTEFAKTVPRGENRAIHNAGHSCIHIDRPDAVLQAVRDIAIQSESSPM